MVASGTTPACAESVPTRAATVIEVFRMFARRAKPAVRWFGLPLAEWAMDATEIRKLRLLLGLLPGCLNCL